MHVIAIGDCFNGIILLGPFDSFDEALNHAEEECLDGDWSVVKIETPKEEL